MLHRPPLVAASSLRGENKVMRRAIALSLVTVWLAAIVLNPGTLGAAGLGKATPAATNQTKPKTRATATPIQHIVVIFQENISFDHYFGTYPVATNPPGEPTFNALPGTPTVNGLTPELLTNNPNFLNQNNSTGAANPFRLDRSQALTADQDHDYTPEQMAFDAGLMDLFPLSVGAAGPPPNPPPGTVLTPGLTMGYYDGNTVTGLWNYAQHFAMSDNNYGTTFGPSTVGAINLISGQTNGVSATLNGTGDETDGGDGSLTVIGDPNPIGDVCTSSTSAQATMGGTNIGSLLTAAGVTWGWFAGGFNLTVVNPNGTTGCNRTHTGETGENESDYIPHHTPFQYYPATANPNHTRPTSLQTIGHAGDPANNEYDLLDFFSAVKAGNFPQVSFLKADGYQDGHAGYSDPLDEQNFLINTINFIEQQPEWNSTLIIITYDDSDGWYDHQIGPIINQSAGSADALTGTGACGSANNNLPGINSGNLHATGRCGYGPRLPLMVISPYAVPNFVGHAVTDQSSIIHFVEDNWLSGERIGQGSFDAESGPINYMLNFNQTPNPPLYLVPSTGEPQQ
jgi:phospholipase C